MLPIFQTFARFGRNERGTVAILFGITLLGLCMMIGVALDGARAYNASTRVQAALDAAALAGAKAMDIDGATNSDIEAAARNYFDAQLTRLELTRIVVDDFEATPNWSTRTVVAAATVAVPSMFGAVAHGSSHLTFRPNSSATFRAIKIELALVVDVTGSMCDVPPAVTDPPCTSGAKLDALKAAAADMVDALFVSNPAPGSVKVALVPYAGSVNAAAYANSVSDNLSTDNCVIERSGPQAFTNAPPTGANALGVADTITVPYYSCPIATIRPLADLSNTTQRNAFKAAIANLSASGGTAGHLGLAWGWYMLSPEWNGIWSGNSARPYDLSNVIKAVVFMTDGDFNIAYANGGEVHPWPDLLSADPNEPGSSPNQALAVCDAMRNPGTANESVSIYTVAFQAPPAAEALLKQCAGDANHYDAANASQLSDAFKSIVERLNSLRVTS